jgi:hypothetical protein
MSAAADCAMATPFPVPGPSSPCKPSQPAVVSQFESAKNSGPFPAQKLLNGHSDKKSLGVEEFEEQFGPILDIR